MKILEKILVPLDGSELSARILKPVAKLARTTGARVRAIRVLDGYEADQAMLRGEDPHAKAAAELTRMLLPLASAGVEAGFGTLLGDPAARIIESAGDGTSLIAMATHGRTGVERFFRGSVAERVLRHSPVPVLLANPRAIADGGLAIERVLVPLDGSELAASVLPLATAIAEANGAELVLLTVIPRESDGSPPPAPSDAPGAALEMLDEVARGISSVPVRTRVASGSPALGILQAADAERASLIAMTTHGRSGVSRWAFGSTAEDVLRHAAAPLLVVRARGSGGR